jgi:TonB family protein
MKILPLIAWLCIPSIPALAWTAPLSNGQNGANGIQDIPLVAAAIGQPDRPHLTVLAQAEESNAAAVRREAGPSENYGARIRAAIRPHIHFNPDGISGNPKAEVKMRVAPDGAITSVKLTQSSGVPLWDNAVLHALYETHALPRDVDGRVFSPMVILFGLRD